LALHPVLVRGRDEGADGGDLLHVLPLPHRFFAVKAVLRLSNRRAQCNPQGGGGESFGAM
ncbi:hypothetical protein, partial [Rathayibacter sp. AY1A4]|uniref:hypothetical protein n=1 Tax=Rathayibacter sp. AY1A4 TaxID=2080522 RepID=UPI001CA59C79